ncbi:hypothetical protein BZG36_03272, partial [Bifiguratus adelaidae]
MSRLYGIDREIKKRLDAKYDPEHERQAREWLELVSGEPFPSDDFQESLKDGVILCKVMDKISPGTIKYKKSNIPFVQVVDAIFSVSRYAHKNGFDAPYLGPKLADKREVQFTQEQLNASKAIHSIQYGYTGGANQSGMSFGSRREISG